MECNFDSKIKDIEKLLNCWMYRTLTVYGKAVIIKTLALSKLSHLALVLPNLDKKGLKQLKIYFFLFCGEIKLIKLQEMILNLMKKQGVLVLLTLIHFGHH